LLGIPGAAATGITTHDLLISTLITVVEAIMLEELDLTASSVTSYDEKFDIGRAGQREIAVRRCPLVSVTALTDDGGLVSSSDYYTTEYGQVRLIGGSDFFTTGRQTVEITYTAGFSTVPEDLKHAATLIVAAQYNQSSHLGYNRESIGAYSYAIGNDGAGIYLPNMAQRILNNYRRIFVRSPGT
jgi:hypothetical protein